MNMRWVRAGIAAIALGSSIKAHGQQPGLVEDLRKTNVSKLSELLPISSYKGKRPLLVYQGEAMVAESSYSIGALYTLGATSCAILIAVVKNKGSVVRIGMAHIDRAADERSIYRFYKDLLSKGNTVEVYVISGVEENALKVLRVSRNMGVPIKFFNADLDGSRNDAAIVDMKGHVYQGSAMDLERSKYIAQPFEDAGIAIGIDRMRNDILRGHLLLRDAKEFSSDTYGRGFYSIAREPAPSMGGWCGFPFCL